MLRVVDFIVYASPPLLVDPERAQWRAPEPVLETVR